MKHLLLNLSSGVLIAVVLAFPSMAFSQILVNDLINLKQNVTDYLVTIKQLKADYTQITQLDKSIELAFRQAQALSGSRGMSSLANNEIYKKHRRSLPFKNRYILDRLARGKLPENKSDLADGLLGLIDIYSLHSNEVNAEDKDKQVIVANTLGQKSAIEQFNLRSTTRKKSASVLTNANAQLALSNSRRNIDNFEGFLTELENTEDIKATNDLLARISTENGLVLNQLLQLQATDISGRSERNVANDSKKRIVDGNGITN